MSSDKARAPAASPAPALSPIVQLLPTGYRDIQPFQRGQGWHSNGKASAKLRHARETPERVVFPAIPSHAAGAGSGGSTASDAAAGPSLSVVVDRYDASDDARERVHGISPSVSAIPAPPPRRPTSGSHAEGNQRASSSSGSFRTRAIAASSSQSLSQKNRLSPTASGGELAAERDDEDLLPPPDPAAMEKLWEEYNQRARHPTKTIDKEAYHRKMQHRYNEAKALRERIARLEMELEDVQRERDEALEAAQRSAEQAAVQSKKWRDPEQEDPVSSAMSHGAPAEPLVGADDTSANTSHGLSHQNSSSERSLASIAAHRRQQPKQVQGATGPEEVSYREKATKLERTMAAAKEGVAQLQARLLAMHENDRKTIERLRAQLELEQQASKLLSVQLRETNAAFRSTTDELVSTQVELEKVQIEKQIVVEHIQADTRQLISDQRRKELQSRVKNVVRTLGKEALHQKMEALHTRVMTAEHHMRAAQLEVRRLKEERHMQQQRIDEILSSREIKYHCLASHDGGIPGILKRAASLYQGTRTMNDQFILVQMLYEDRRGPADSVIEPSSNQTDPPTELDDEFCIHLLVYEAFAAQDDYLTFHLRDIQRLVPDAEKYLARFADRKKERFLELAELLFAQCHLGYKNGHIVLTERPSSPDEIANREKREIVIYRGSRYIRSTWSAANDAPLELLVDLVINEVYDPSTSQLWWLEVRATAIDLDSNQDQESQLTVDSQVLNSIVRTFAGYRPSESIQALQLTGHLNEFDAFAIHEDLLDPLFDRFEWRWSDDSSSKLALVDADGITIVCDGLMQNAPIAPVADENDTHQQMDIEESEFDSTNASSPNIPRVLDHRSIVSINDTFFCVRIEEVWDGELMLRVTMEEPDDAMNRYHTILHEERVSAIAAYLFSTGLCDTDYSATIKFGLPPSLHDAMCRVLKKHAQPVLLPATETPQTAGYVKTHTISFDSLLHDARASIKFPRASDSKAERRDLLLPEVCIIGRRRIDQVTIIGEGIDEQVVPELLSQVFGRDNGTGIDRLRVGCRMEESSTFAMMSVYSGFSTPAEDIVVVDMWRITSATVLDPRLVISGRPLHGTLQLLGFRSSSSTTME